ncbi:MAG: hypothetical protein MZV65_15300 [Chromatiales bacterium]|nr:hypothetical protein [Chromatiales bacterium]
MTTRARGARAGARHALAAPADAAQPPAALPGRAVGHAGPGRPARRRRACARMPVASCPCDDRNLHFFIAARRRATRSRARLFDGGVKPGDAVTVWGPRGRVRAGRGHRARWSSPPATPASRRSRA